jgi:hypothetical protein
VSAQVPEGVPVVLVGCSSDGQYGQVEHIGQQGWVEARDVASNLPEPCQRLPTVVPTHTPSPTPTPTAVALPTPTPAPPPKLVNGTFDGIQTNYVPGWQRWADKTCESKDDYPNCRDKPLYKQADDAVREISGPTLQIDAPGYVYFRAGVFQIVSVPPGTRVLATVQARAYSSNGNIRVHVGIDANGTASCDGADWGPHADLNQDVDIVTLTTREQVAGNGAKITVCLFAETSHPAHSNAAFFDNAELVIRSR